MFRVQATVRAKPDGNTVRRRIIAAARGHFFVHGFRTVTMDELAAGLGMSKKTLYACFPSKIDLLKAVILDKFTDAEADFERATAGHKNDFLADLRELLACVQRNTAEIQPPFIRDMERETPELFAMVESRRRALIYRHFEELFRAGRKAGTVRKDIPVTLIIEILLGVIQAIVNPAKMVELNLTPQTAIAAVLRVVLEGAIIRPNSGRKST